MANHTPGPWWVMRRDRKAFVVNGEDAQPFTGQLIAVETTAPETRANLQLISAAPDLLHACREALCGLPERSPLRPIVEAAIARATGEPGG